VLRIRVLPASHHRTLEDGAGVREPTTVGSEAEVRRMSFLDRHLPAAQAAATLTLIGAIGFLWFVLSRDGVAAADNWSSLVGTSLALVAAAVGLGGALRRRRRLERLPLAADDLQSVKETLAGLLLAQYAQETAVRSLGDPDSMPVRWRADDATIMDHPERIGPLATAFNGQADQVGSIVADFRALPQSRLLIVGGPGTGKTSLAILMAVEMLRDRAEADPVPVLATVSDWDTAVHPGLAEWLADRLSRDYPGPHGLGRNAYSQLLSQGQLIPVLDGLDEVVEERRAAILRTINDSIHAIPSLVATCRRGQYASTTARTGQVLKATLVIRPYALRRTEAADYLRTYLPRQPGPEWSQVLSRLRDGSVPGLSVAASNPLGLWLIRAVYVEDSSRSPSSLIDPGHPDRRGAATLKEHLLQQLVPAVLRSHGSPSRTTGDTRGRTRRLRRYRPDKVRRWLSVVAAHMDEGSTPNWNWWQSVRYARPTRLGRMLFRLQLPALCLLVGAVLVGLQRAVFGVPPSFLVGQIETVLLMLLVVLATAALFARFAASPAHIDVRLRGNRKGGLAGLAAVALLISYFWFQSELRPVLGLPPEPLSFSQRTILSLMALAFTLPILTSTRTATSAPTPRASSRGDMLRAVLILMVATASWVLLLVLPDATAAPDDTVSPVPDVVRTLFTGIWVSGAIAALTSAYSGYLVYVVNHAIIGRAPWRLMRFLEDSHRMGLLRTVGPTYQFRHGELQSHLTP
jgi:hypothetical protein